MLEPVIPRDFPLAVAAFEQWRVDAASFGRHIRPHSYTHQANWFFERITRPGYYRIVYCSAPFRDLVGFVRIDKKAVGERLSISLTPNARNKGYGTAVLRFLGEEFRLKAWVNRYNYPSKIAFSKAGWVPEVRKTGTLYHSPKCDTI